ncbi:MAG TPA: tRNA lysidine(34) synthetase TilS [Candidatus Limnocylindria bacterium]
MATLTPRAIVSTVGAFARRHELFRPGPLVVAVSGGTDSVALALILAELREEFGLVLHVAYFDHRTRPRTAAADAAFVARLADHIGAPIRAGRAAKATKSEDDARRERYAFLRRVAADVGATAIATGHTLDDQAETVLLHLTRGSGIAGAAGMRPLRDGIARPLLAIGRAETAAICRAAKIRPHEDPSNRALRFARNRVRRNVLPELAKINPQVGAALARFADAAAEVEAAAAVPRHVGPGPITVAGLPSDDAGRERALAEAWVAAGGEVLSARHRAALRGLAASSDGTRRIDLPGGSAVREYASITFVRESASAKTASRSRTAALAGTDARDGAPTPLTRGTPIHWHDWRIALGAPSDGLPFTATIDAASASRMHVRARRPGDRIAGHGKLQDVFVDAKVPTRLRDTWPLVTLNGTVVWVPGLTPAPQTGTVHLAAGPVETTPTAGDTAFTFSSQNRQVASKSEARPRGEKRGRP